MANYNLTDNVKDSFGCNIRELKFSVRYPRTEELEEVQAINDELEEAKKNKDKDSQKSANNALEAFLYQFITPEGHDTSIEEALKKENIMVLRNFQVMVRKELSLA